MKAVILITFLITNICFAQRINPFVSAKGSEGGGGGEVKIELQIKNIRDSLLEWIKRGDAEGLQFPSRLNYQTYLYGDKDKNIYGMIEVLNPGSVIVTSFNNENEDKKSPLLNTYVDGVPKDCKGLIYKNRAHIVCHEERFLKISEEKKFQLIHHEYASLARLEQNIGADSDYSLSKQITIRHEYMKVAKPILKKMTTVKNQGVSISEWDDNILAIKNFISNNRFSCKRINKENNKVRKFGRHRNPVFKDYFFAKLDESRDLLLENKIKIIKKNNSISFTFGEPWQPFSIHYDFKLSPNNKAIENISYQTSIYTSCDDQRVNSGDIMNADYNDCKDYYEVKSETICIFK